MSETTIVMTVRHGDTDFNQEKRYAGLLDVPLNEKGIRDAASAGRDLHLRVDVAISSALRRAVDTARLLIGDAQEIIQCDLCNERNFGEMQGRTSDEVETLKPVIRYIKIGGDFHSLNPPSGETFPALRRRVKEFADYVTGEFAGSSILVVSHEVFLLQFHGFLRGETWQQALSHRLPNLTLTTFSIQDGRAVSEESRPLVSRAQDEGPFFTVLPGGRHSTGPSV